MQKLLLSLLLSHAVVTTSYAQDIDNQSARDLVTDMEIANPTTSDNPNPQVTGNIAQLHFKIDVASELGQKIISLLNFCAELTSQETTEDATVIADLTGRFNQLTPKEKQFIQVVIAATSGLKVATEELIASYENPEAQNVQEETTSDNQ